MSAQGQWTMGNSNRNDKKEFLFVNKDVNSKSLSKSDGADAKEINRFAQQVRSRRNEVQKLQAAKKSSSSARRIALGGWNRRTTPSLSLDTTSNASSPAPTPRLQSSPLSAPTPSTWSIESPLLEVSPQSALTSKSSPGQSTRQGDEDLSRRRFAPRRLIQSANTIQRYNRTRPSIPVFQANFRALDCIDPFGSTPITVDGRVHLVLQYMIRVYAYAANNYKIAHLPPNIRSSITQFPIHTVVQRSLYKEHHLWALMAISSVRLRLFIGLEDLAENPDRLRATASHHLRKELLRNAESGEVDAQTILDILFLVVSETQHKKYESAREHLRVVSRLYHFLNLKTHFDFWVSETAAHVDNQLALATGSQPILSQNFDPGPMLPERMQILQREVQAMQLRGQAQTINTPSPMTSTALTNRPVFPDAIADLASTLDLRMGSQFEAGLSHGVFTGIMHRIVTDLVDCISIAKVVWLSPLAVCFDAEWLCRKARALLRSLMIAGSATTENTEDVTETCMECLRLSLLILLTHACTIVGFQTAKQYVKRLHPVQARGVKIFFPQVGLNEDGTKMDDTPLHPFLASQVGYVLWSLLTGVFASGDLPEGEWFVDRAAKTARSLGYVTYEDLHNHMSEYLYSRTLQEESLRRVNDRMNLLRADSVNSTIK